MTPISTMAQRCRNMCDRWRWPRLGEWEPQEEFTINTRRDELQATLSIRSRGLEGLELGIDG